MIKTIYLFVIMSLVVLLSVFCSRSVSLSNKSGQVSLLQGKWKATGYYSTHYRGSTPLKKWVSYPSGAQFTYEFGRKGKLSTSEMANHCEYHRYSLKSSIHLQLFSNTCPSENFSILKLTADSLYLSKSWYENSYVYIFVKVRK